jgi:beta-N-acetylhexosaminidase
MTLGPLMIDVAGLSLSAEETEWLKDRRVGGVILFSRNFDNIEQVRALVASIHDVRAPQLLVAVDQEGGRVQRFKNGFTRLPAARWLGNQYEMDAAGSKQLARRAGWLMAAELRDIGIDMSFAPVVDLDLGLSEVIGDRAIHKDPDVVTSLATAYMLGMREAGMAAVAKHFPGHGAVVPDSHLELPEDHRSLDEMKDDLTPYRGLILNGLQGVMVAHVKYPQVDRRIASLSPFWLQTELRRKLGFVGAIFSDDLNMAAVGTVGDMPERVRSALDAGSDMALICNNPDAVAQTLNEIGELQNPVGQGRLVALRPHVPAWAGTPLRETEEWKRTVEILAAADEPPPLQLDG